MLTIKQLEGFTRNCNSALRGVRMPEPDKILLFTPSKCRFMGGTAFLQHWRAWISVGPDIWATMKTVALCLKVTTEIYQTTWNTPRAGIHLVSHCGVV